MELQWPLILFTAFIAWSAGLFATQGIYALRGKAPKAQMPALIASVALMAVGGIAVFFHLQHWERIFNGFGHITSGITQELVAIVVMFAVMVVFFVYLRRTGDEAKIPSWVSVLAIATSVILVCVMGRSYMMASLPTWNSVLQIGSLLGAACALGPATMALISGLKEQTSDLEGLANLAGQAANTVLTAAYVVAMSVAASSFTSVPYWFDPCSPTQAMTDATTLSPFAGDALGFSVGAIVLALAGLTAAFMGKKQGTWKTWGAAGMVAALASTICLRILFYQMGVSVYPLL